MKSLLFSLLLLMPPALALESLAEGDLSQAGIEGAMGPVPVEARVELPPGAEEVNQGRLDSAIQENMKYLDLGNGFRMPVDKSGMPRAGRLIHDVMIPPGVAVPPAR